LHLMLSTNGDIAAAAIAAVRKQHTQGKIGQQKGRTSLGLRGEKADGGAGVTKPASMGAAIRREPLTSNSFPLSVKGKGWLSSPAKEVPQFADRITPSGLQVGAWMYNSDICRAKLSGGYAP
jgi:hypothetical protein